MIFILATGALSDTLQQTREEREKWVEDGCPMNACTVIPDAYLLLDPRASMSKLVKLAAYGVSRAENDVILIVPDEGMIDKRVRNKATILKLKPYETPTLAALRDED